MLGNPDRPVGGIAVRAPDGVELRPAGRDDLATAVALARELRDMPPLPRLDAQRARFEAMVNSPDSAPFLAVANGEPAGLAVLILRRRLNFATFEGWLSDWYVRPAFRGRGIGRALLEAATAEWGLRRGHRLQLQVAHHAEPARQLLAAAGFVEWMVDFRLAPIAVPHAAEPQGVRLRPLSSEDADAVTRLIAEFGPHHSPVPDRMDAVMRTYATHARAVAAGGAASLVAELDGRVVGACVLDWREPFWDVARQAWIHDLVVTEPIRGRGIGRALLNAALARAAETGCAEVRLESGLRRASAHGLYRSVGFEETGRTWILQRDR